MYTMAAQDVEVIKLAGSCEPRAGPTQPAFPEIFPDAPEEFPAPPMSPADRDEARVLKRRVGKYRSLFPGETQDLDLDPRSLDALSIDEIRERAKDVEYVVSTRRSSKAVRGMFLGGLASVELVAGPILGLRLENLSTFASRSEDLLMTVDECGVKYGDQLYVDPAIRLAMAVVQLSLAVNEHNCREAAKLAGTVSGDASANISATPVN